MYHVEITRLIGQNGAVTHYRCENEPTMSGTDYVIFKDVEGHNHIFVLKNVYHIESWVDDADLKDRCKRTGSHVDGCCYVVSDDDGQA